MSHPGMASVAMELEGFTGRRRLRGDCGSIRSTPAIGTRIEFPSMAAGHTTAVVQQYLDALAGDADAEPIIRALLERSAARLQMLSSNMLHRSYPRLTRPPLNLQQDELLSAVVERLLKALRAVRPGTVRQFFALANQHMRWELNDLARRLDEQPRLEAFIDGSGGPAAPAAPSGASAASRLPAPGSTMRRLLDAIETLPEAEREVFSLVRIQGMTHVDVADVLDVSSKTVQRRLNRSLMLLMDKIGDLRPGDDAAVGPGADAGATAVL